MNFFCEGNILQSHPPSCCTHVVGFKPFREEVSSDLQLEIVIPRSVNQTKATPFLSSQPQLSLSLAIQDLSILESFRIPR
jgi:hypothetical protein